VSQTTPKATHGTKSAHASATASAGKNGQVRILTRDEIVRLSYTPPSRPALPAASSTESVGNTGRLRPKAHAKNRIARKEACWNKRRLDFDERANGDRRPPGAVEDALIAIIDCHAQQHDETREIDAWAIARHEHTKPKPRGKAEARGGQRTSLRRAVAWPKTEGAVVPDDVALIVAHLLAQGLGVDVGAIGKGRRGKGGHLSVVTVGDMWSAWTRAEFAAFAVKVLGAAHRFYRATRDAFPSQKALEAVLSEWTHAMPPAELRPVLAFANILPRGALKVLGRERGRNAGGWAGNTRVDVSVGGVHVGGKRAAVDQTRHVEVDLLDAKRLDVLYGSGRRAGAREAAKAVTADIVNRSRAQVENLARTADAAVAH
jgi:hypothetical protein